VTVSLSVKTHEGSEEREVGEKNLPPVYGSAPCSVAILEFGDVCLEALPQVGEPGRQHLGTVARVANEAPVERARLTIVESELADFARVPELERFSQGGDVALNLALRGIQPTEVKQRAEVCLVRQFDPLVAERDDHASIVAETRGVDADERDAAAATGVSYSTARRRADDPAFREQLEAAGRELSRALFAGWRVRH
jgi:hypothetical protein